MPILTYAKSGVGKAISKATIIIWYILTIVRLRLCGGLGHRRPKMFFGTFSLGKNPLKFMFLRPLPLNEGKIA